MATARALVLLAVGATLSLGCSGGDDDGAGLGDGGIPPLEEWAFPRTGQTGFDGVNAFKMPVGVTLDDVTWEIADPSVVALEAVPAPDEADVGLDSWVMLTSLAPGTTTVRAEADGRHLISTVVVVEYDAGDVAIGAARYNDDDGSGSPDRVPCAGCHLQLGGADHSPLAVSIHLDPDLLTAITTGQYADGTVLVGVDHTWDIAEGEQVGIVAYLRTLPPRGF